MRHIIAFIVIAAVAACPALGQENKDQIQVPVTGVVLFSSGVGYFEHNGTVEGDAVMQLMFKTEQINDVLKSMILMDQDGGTVSSVNYASQDPLIRALKSFAVDVSGDPNMAALLSQLRGAEIVVMVPDKIAGRVLGVESREQKVTAGGAMTILGETYLNIVTDKGMKSVPMSTVQSLELADKNLQSELDKALKLLIASHDTQRKPVEMHFKGKGKRRVTVAYISETPVWKTSYRLMLSGEKPRLQGWAIVENTSDNDWTNVGLSLVSGRPISFIQDLYTPLYLPRPIVQPELYASLRPKTYEEGIEKDRLKAMAAAPVMEAIMPSPAAPRPMAAARKAGGPAGRAEAKEELQAADYGGLMQGQAQLDKGVESIASAAKIGELFNFAMKEPVSLSRRRSAMLPVINSAISAEKVSIYNAATLPRNPLNGAYLTNDTGMKMLGGPITVFDAGMYAGDAQIDNLAEKDKRLISYAIDLNVTVDPSAKTDSRITSAKIVRGALSIQRLQSFQQTYAIKNKADEKRTIIVEHPFSPERKLVEPAKFEEKTPALYRFRVPVDKGSTADFTVKEEQTYTETIAILPCAPDTLLYYSKTGEISQKVRDALAEAIRLKNDLAAAEAKLRDLESQKQQIESGQDRLRKNVETAGKDTELGKRYLKKLSDQEDDIEKLAGQIAELRAQVEQKRKAMDDYINGLNVE